MENFFIIFTPKHQATNEQRRFCGFLNLVLVYLQLIPLAYVVGYGFRLGFGG